MISHPIPLPGSIPLVSTQEEEDEVIKQFLQRAQLTDEDLYSIHFLPDASLLDEIQRSEHFQHDNLVKVLGCFYRDNVLNVIWENVQFFSVPPLENILVSVVHQIASALEYLLTNHKTAHQNVKPETIFVKSLEGDKIHVCLGDWKMNTPYEPHHFIVMAPELVEVHEAFTEEELSKSDVFALGATVYQLLTGDKNSHCATLSAHGLIQNIMKTNNCSEFMIQLVTEMTSVNPNDRPTLQDLILRTQRDNLDSSTIATSENISQEQEIELSHRDDEKENMSPSVISKYQTGKRPRSVGDHELEPKKKDKRSSKKTKKHSTNKKQENTYAKEYITEPKKKRIVGSLSAQYQLAQKSDAYGKSKRCVEKRKSYR